MIKDGLNSFIARNHSRRTICIVFIISVDFGKFNLRVYIILLLRFSALGPVRRVRRGDVCLGGEGVLSAS